MELIKQITEQKQERAKLIAEARSVAEVASKAGRNQTAEEVEKCEKLLNAAKELEKSYKASEQILALEKELNASAGCKIDHADPEGKKEKSILAQPEYKAAFMDYLKTGKSTPEFENMSRKAFYQDLPANGGYLVPEELLSNIVAALKNYVWMRGLATVVPVNGAISLGVPTLTTEPDDADWTGEISPAVSEDASMAFGKRELKPHLSSKLVKFSRLLLRNAPYAESFVVDRLAYKFGVTEEKAFLTGTGSGQPLGIFVASDNGIPTSRDVSTSNTSSAPTADGLIAARMSVKAQYRKNACWIFHRDCITKLMSFKDGMGRYLWLPSLAGDKPDTFLGQPVYESEYAPNTFTASQYVGIYGDMKYYYIADAIAFEMQMLVEKYAEYNEIGLIGRKYTDGMPILSEAFARVKLGT